MYDPTNVVVDGLLYYFYGAHGRLISFDLQRDIFGVVPLPSIFSKKGSDILNYQGSVANLPWSFKLDKKGIYGR